MADEKTGKMETFSAKVTKETKEMLAELQASGDFATMNQMIETLVERYYAPIRAKDQTAEIAKLEAKVKELQDINFEITGTSEKVLTDIELLNSQLKAEFLELKEKFDSVVQERNQLEQDIINVTVKGELPENGQVIIIDPLNLAILQFVAERESKARKQDWTIDDVINYFVHFRFNKGSLNGDLKSVPDSVVAKLTKEINAED